MRIRLNSGFEVEIGLRSIFVSAFKRELYVRREGLKLEVWTGKQ